MKVVQGQKKHSNTILEANLQYPSEQSSWKQLICNLIRN